MLKPLDEIINEMWRNRNMPITSRQTPPKATTQFPNGSILSEAVPVTHLREERVKVCFYGRNRSGKTTLASMFPKPLLFVSCEPAHCGGVQSVSNVKDATLLRAEPLKERPKHGEQWGRERVEVIGRELHGTQHYRTVVLKTATSLQDMILEEMKLEFPGIPLNGKGSKDTYGMRASRLHDAMRPYLDLKHVHVVIIAQEKDHNPPKDSETGFPDLKAKLLQTMQQGSFMAPALGAANAQWLQDACGYIIQVYDDELMQDIVVPSMNPDGTPAPPVTQHVPTGKRQRHLRLLYHPNFAAGGKWQYNKDMPEFVTAPDPAGLYAAMTAYIPALK
jgi:hypothetical protein